MNITRGSKAIVDHLSLEGCLIQLVTVAPISDRVLHKKGCMTWYGDLAILRGGACPTFRGVGHAA